MIIKRRQMRNKTFKHIEQELFLYHETKKEIELMREELMTNALYRSSLNVEEGGRSNMPGEPTARLAIKLVDAEENDIRLKTMSQVVRAIEEVFETSSETDKKLIKLYYWTRPQTLTLEGISQAMYISTRHLRRLRYRIAHRIAARLGWW